jgi:hypothetical protein
MLAAAVFLSAGLLSACDDDPTGPNNPPPSSVAATATSATAVTVSFQAVRGATDYVVQRAAGATGTYTIVDTVQTTTFEDAGLQPGTQYRYQVASIVNGRMGLFGAEATVSTLAPGRATATINADITANRTLFADTVYTLRGFVKVASGATLTIQPGTRIQGDYNTVGSSLFILRGARIIARGTRENPIVFTSSRSAETALPGDWGGVILIGRGIINRTSPVILEGTENFPQPINYAGGTDNADSSGELRYVRIEFAGYATQPNAELNTLTLAAVGSGTVIENVQAANGLDDSFEWFGGAVDGKYLVSYEAGDDHFDASEGYVGRNQFMIAFQTKVPTTRPEAGAAASDPQGIENDGCAGSSGCPNGELSTPFTIPMFANFTLVGTGRTATSGGEIGMMLRRGTGGYYVNGIVTRWGRAAISLRNTTTQARATAGDLVIRNVLLAQNGVAFEAGTDRFNVDAAANAIQTADVTAASLFTNLPAAPTQASDLNWSLSAASAARTGGLTSFTGNLATKAGTFVTATAYRGAADPAATTGWWEGWTRYYAK